MGKYVIVVWVLVGLGCYPSRKDSDGKVINPKTSILSAPAILHQSAALLELTLKNGREATCTGVLVGKRRQRVLSADHCFDGVRSVKVKFGVDYRTIKVVHDADMRTLRRRGHGFDIATIDLTTPVSKTTQYQSADIHDPSFSLQVGTNLEFAGWGIRTPQGDYGPEFLRWGEAEFVRFVNKVTFRDGSVFLSQLGFAAVTRDQSYMCSGDSGAGVFAVNPAGVRALVAVHSNSACTDLKFKTGYAADIRPHKAWIFAGS